MIHSTAIISAKAQLGNNVQVGAFSIIEDDVIIGDDCIIGSSVVIKKNSHLGQGNHIFTGVIIGEAPQDSSQKNVNSAVQIGNYNTIREYVTIHRGTDKQNRLTVIGDHNFFMVNAHIGHDVSIADHVIVTNGAAIGGHAIIGNKVIIGALCTIHQFCKVGAYAMLTRGAMVNKDVLPYVMVADNKPKVYGLNKIGLQRNGFDRTDIKTLLRAYKIIFRENINKQQSLEALEPLLAESTAVQALIDGLQNSVRGIVR